MPKNPVGIQHLPTRYEGLSGLLGDNALSTLIPLDQDLTFLKRFLARAKSSRQGKIQFLLAEPGTGKTSFVESLRIFLGDQVSNIVKLPPEYELSYEEIPKYIAQIAPSSDGRFLVISFDGREALSLTEAVHRNMLVQINSLLRQRPDVLVLWPVTRSDFARQVVSIIEEVGGRSSLGSEPIHKFTGLRPDQFYEALQKLLAVANWSLEDAGVEDDEALALSAVASTMGGFLDSLQELIVERFDVEGIGRTIPTLLFVVTSGSIEIREICRNLRRASSFYLEAARLLMYTRRSNIAEWWQNRNASARTSLAHAIAMFNAQLTSMSAASMVHSVANSTHADLKPLADGVQSNQGAVTNVIRSTELFKYLAGEAIDIAKTGSPIQTTLDAYARIQARSETHHRALNEILVSAVCGRLEAAPRVEGYEMSLVQGLQTDVALQMGGDRYAVEFHHKAASESTENKIAIYILTKLQEYAINFGLTSR